jgi:hypothetical protein
MEIGFRVEYWTEDNVWVTSFSAGGFHATYDLAVAAIKERGATAEKYRVVGPSYVWEKPVAGRWVEKASWMGED